MSEHQPTSDTIRRRNPLTKNTGFVLPIGVALGFIVVLCGWAYGKIEAHDRTSIEVDHLKETCVEANRAINTHAEQINEAKAERVYMRVKLDEMHNDIQEIKQAVKSR